MEQCPLCVDFATPTFQLLIQHIGKVHSKSSDFHLTCGVDDCQTTYTNFAAFKRHLRKKHRSKFGEPTSTTSEVQTHDGDFLDNGDEPFGDPSDEEYRCRRQFPPAPQPPQPPQPQTDAPVFSRQPLPYYGHLNYFGPNQPGGPPPNKTVHDIEVEVEF